jgi:restriction endonuclease S subunit
MKNNLGKLQIFSITNEDATKKKRIDVEYYQPFFEDVVKKVAGSKYELQKLEDITLLISNGRTPSKDMYDEDNDQAGSVPIIKAGTASGRFVDLEKLEYAKADFSSGKKAQKGDIFVLSAAHQASYVGKNVSLLDIEPEQDTYFVGELICIRANQEKVLPEYLFGFLSSEVGYLLLNREKRGQTSHIYPEDVKTIPLPIPSLKDQQKIVAILGKAYEEKKQKEAEIKMILAKIDSFVLGELGIEMPEGGAERVYSVWSDLLLGGRLDAEYYNPFYDLFYKKLSDGKYQLTMIEDVATDVFQGVGKKETENPEFTLLKVKNIKKNNEIDFEDTEFVESVPEDKVLQNGDILSPFIGEAVRQCKFSVFENGEKKFAVDNNTGVIRIDNTKANSEYVAYALNSQIGNMQLKHLIGGGGVPFLGSENARKLKIPLPPVAIQKKIVDKIKEQHNKARNLRQEAESVIAEAQKQTAEMIFA